MRAYVKPIFSYIISDRDRPNTNIDWRLCNLRHPLYGGLPQDSTGECVIVLACDDRQLRSDLHVLHPCHICRSRNSASRPTYPLTLCSSASSSSAGWQRCSRLPVVRCCASTIGRRWTCSSDRKRRYRLRYVWCVHQFVGNNCNCPFLDLHRFWASR